MQAIGMAMQNKENSNNRLQNEGACLNIASKTSPPLKFLAYYDIRQFYLRKRLDKIIPMN